MWMMTWQALSARPYRDRGSSAGPPPESSSPCVSKCWMRLAVRDVALGEGPAARPPPGVRSAGRPPALGGTCPLLTPPTPTLADTGAGG
jgi:hypothetical protein